MLRQRMDELSSGDIVARSVASPAEVMTGLANTFYLSGRTLHGHAWLHSRCWTGWYKDRKDEAASALVARGIEKPTDFPNDFGKNRSA